MGFLTEPAPEPFTPVRVAPGILRLVAPNPGPLTAHGTNTWLVEEPEGLVVIDPGPADERHLRAILSAGPILRIILTHSHADHMAAAPALRDATGAPVAGFARPAAGAPPGFAPDLPLADGDAVDGLRALHTPGHASDHLCLAHDTAGVLFTGDHVMSWNTSVVALPDGDMAAYMAGLRRLLDRHDRLYLCGHGPPLQEPRTLVRAMLGHRLAREAAIVAAVSGEARTEAQITAALYGRLDPQLARAAALTVQAHLAKLLSEQRIQKNGEAWLPA